MATRRLATTLALTLLFLAAPASHATTYTASYREHAAEVERFLDFGSQDYRKVARFCSKHAGQEVCEWQYPPEMMKDADLGYRPRPLAEVRHIARTERGLIYDAVYHFDEFGRRVAPVDAPENRDKFLLLYGCSYTYGNGLNDDQTLNYHLGRELKDFHPYNYAIGASGPNSMLALIQEDRFRNEIPQKRGVFIYVFLEGSHVNRAVGKPPSISWIADTPYYDRKGDELVRRGSLITGRPVQSIFYLALFKTLKLLRGQADEELMGHTDEDYEYACALVRKSRDTFLEQYPGSRFIVYNHPIGLPLDERSKRCFETHGIEYYQGKIDHVPGLTIPGDGHPTAKATALVADDLARIVRRKN